MGSSDIQQTVIAEFTHQADAFSRAAVYELAETLDEFVSRLPVAAGSRWVDVACGTGTVARAIAQRGATAVGVDVTAAMLRKAEEQSRGLSGVQFWVADATNLPFVDGLLDGAVSRFSLHHIPAPARVLAEMARVVRSGGVVAIADHLTSEDARVATWHHDIERLRDPSHWQLLSPNRLFALGDPFGLRLTQRALVPFDMDFEEWLTRGSGGASQRTLIESLIAQEPDGSRAFFGRRGARLHFLLGIAVWERVG